MNTTQIFTLRVKIDDGLNPSIARYKGLIDTYSPYFNRYDIATCNKVSIIREFMLNLTMLSPTGQRITQNKKTILSVLNGILQEAYYDEAIENNGAKKLDKAHKARKA